MEKTDKEKRKCIDRIGKKANKELSALDISGITRMLARAGETAISLMQFADEMKISRDVMLIYASNALLAAALSEPDKSDNPTIKIYDPSDYGFKQ